MNNIVNFVFFILGLIIIIALALRFMKQLLAKTTEVEAIVADKQVYTREIYAKSQAPSQAEIYTVTFLCGSKKLTFYTNADTYHSLRIKQKGILIHKGLTFLDFRAK